MKALVFFFLIAVPSFGQTESDTASLLLRINQIKNCVCHCNRSSSLKDSLAEFENMTKALPRLRTVHWERMLENSCLQQCYSLWFGWNGGNSNYLLNTYSINDTLIYVSLNSVNEISEPVIINQEYIRSIIIKRRTTYGRQQHYEDLISDFGINDIYADGCGEFGSPPELKKLQTELIDESDTAALCKWLCSVNPEKQAYGLNGLWELKNRGIILNQTTLQIMQHVASLNTTVYSCQGCVMHTSLSIQNLVPGHKIKKYERRIYRHTRKRIIVHSK